MTNDKLVALTAAFEDAVQLGNANIEAVKNYLQGLQGKSLSIKADNGTLLSLNPLYAGGTQLMAVAPAEAAAHQDKQENTFKQEDVGIFFDLIKEMSAQHRFASFNRQETRKNDLQVGKITDGLNAISANLNNIDKYTVLKNQAQTCIVSINGETLNEDIMEVCETKTLPKIRAMAAEINVNFENAKSSLVNILAEYAVVQYEHSTDFKKQLFAVSDMLATQDVRAELGHVSMNRANKLLKTHKDAAKEACDGLISAQHSAVKSLNLLHSKNVITPIEKDSNWDNFACPIDRNFDQELKSHREVQFKSIISEISKDFAEAGLSVSDFNNHLTSVLNTYCSGETPEDKMYCEFKDVVGAASENAQHHYEL